MFALSVISENKLITLLKIRIMTKKIMTLAVAFATMFSLSSFAQTTEGCKKEGKCVKTEKCEGKKDCKKNSKKGERKDCKKGDMKKCFNPFQGIELTADQQTKLKAIPTPREVMKASKTEKTAVNVNPQDFVKTVRKDYLQQVQQVLTPAQYVQFLENSFVNQRAGHGAKGVKGDRGMKKGAKGHHGQHDKKGPRHDMKGDRVRK